MMSGLLLVHQPPQPGWSLPGGLMNRRRVAGGRRRAGGPRGDRPAPEPRAELTPTAPNAQVNPWIQQVDLVFTGDRRRGGPPRGHGSTRSRSGAAALVSRSTSYPSSPARRWRLLGRLRSWPAPPGRTPPQDQPCHPSSRRPALPTAETPERTIPGRPRWRPSTTRRQVQGRPSDATRPLCRRPGGRGRYPPPAHSPNSFRRRSVRSERFLCSTARLSRRRRGLGLVGPGRRRGGHTHHHRRERSSRPLEGRAHLSVEEPVALGTAGAIGRAPRVDRRARTVLILNADAYLAGPTPSGLSRAKWDGERPRLLVVQARRAAARLRREWRFAGVSLLPAPDGCRRLVPEPTGLYEVVWRDAWSAERAGSRSHSTGVFVDCGTPAGLPRGEPRCRGSGSLIAESAQVTGAAHNSVVGAGGDRRRHDRAVRRVAGRPPWHPGEHLKSAIRTPDGQTVVAG